MKNETKDFTSLVIRAICGALLICVALLASGVSALAQLPGTYEDDTYGPGGSKEIGKTVETKDSSGNKVLINSTYIRDGSPNKVTRELHVTYTDPVTKKVVGQTDRYFDCKGNLTSSKDVRYDQLGNEIYREEAKFKDGKQTSGSERGTDANGKKFKRSYNPNTKKYEDADVAFEPPTEISAPRDTSVCPVNNYANQIVGGFNIIREDSTPDNFNTYGLDLSFTHNFEHKALSRVGGSADFNVNFRNQNGVDLKKISVLGGFTILPFNGAMTTDKVTVSTHALVGFSQLTSSFGTVSASQNSFTMKLGGAVDVNVNQHFFIRPIQIDYAPTHFGGVFQNNVQFTFGAGVRFGHVGSTPVNVPKGP